MNENQLRYFFQENSRVALGFSGGVDSAYLLWAGIRAGAEVRPYFIKTVFQPDFELKDAEKMAEWLGVKLTVLQLDILKEKEIAANPKNRCYYCKRALFGTLKEQAIKDGCMVLMDGTNASDEEKDRPGMTAIHELSVRSPLRECGFTKKDVRMLSQKAGLFTWNKPAYACLATRIPSGREITVELLEKIEKGEEALTRMGFCDFRIRLYGDAARLQFSSGQMAGAVEYRKEILKALQPWFNEVFLDFKER